MNVITALTNPVWRDTGVNVEVYGGNGRYDVRWPTLSGTSGAPDFTTRTDAFRYAQHVAKAMRATRNIAHGTALREQARRAATRTTTIDLVLRDAVGCMWSLVGPDLYVPAQWVASGRFPDSERLTRLEVEKYDGPITVVHSIEIKGELVTAPYPSAGENRG
jgi:hypothetical protein